MRKYTQLGLVVACVVSVIGLLIMERQYSNMKVFLEVSDIFQNSESNSKCVQKLESLRSTLESQYMQSVHRVNPGWSQIGMSTFVYSALYVPNRSVASVLLVSDARPNSCRLWFGSETVANVDAVVKILESSSGFYAMAVECLNMYRNSTPLAVEIFDTLVPIEEQRSRRVEHVAICISPLTFNTSEVQVAEFLAFHSHMGVDRFYLYDRNLAGKVKTFVRRIAYIDQTLRADLLQWNAPTSIGLLSDPILRADCLLRAGVDSKHVAIFNINEFFVLRRGMRNLTILLDSVTQDNSVLAVHERTFCEEYQDDVIASALNYPFVTLRKTKFISSDSGKQHRTTFVRAGELAHLPLMLRTGKNSETHMTIFVSEDTAHVNVYKSCARMHDYIERRNLQTPTDTFLTSFHELLFDSKLYKSTLRRSKSASYRLLA